MMYTMTVKGELVSELKSHRSRLQWDRQWLTVVWCRCGFVRSIRFTCRWRYRVLMSWFSSHSLPSLTLFFCLSLDSDAEDIFPRRRVPWRLIRLFDRFSRRSVVPQERSLPGIPSITTLVFRRSTSDRNRVGQSQSPRISVLDYKAPTLLRRSGRGKEDESGRENGSPVRRWHVKGALSHVRARTGQCFRSEIRQDIAWTCEVFAEGSRAIQCWTALNLKLEYQSTFGAVGGSIWEAR